MVDAKLVADDPLALTLENSTYRANMGGVGWTKRLRQATEAVLHGATQGHAGSLQDTAAEIHDWLGAACPTSATGPPLPDYNSAEERRAALWVAVLQQLVSDAEIDAFSAEAKGRPLLSWWRLSLLF
jgi:hypothetical protein